MGFPTQLSRGGSKRVRVPRISAARSRTVQLNSWFSKYGSPKYKGLVGQIFFPTDVHALDSDDRNVLNSLVENLKIAVLGRVTLNFIGHADYRGKTNYNLKLGLKRAQMVKTYVDTKIKQSMVSMPNGYKSIAKSFGEIYASKGSLSGDRRVDIFSDMVIKHPPLKLEPVEITGKYDGPLSNIFEFRTISGGGVGIGPVAAQVFSVSIRNFRTQKTAIYTYTGAGIGGGISINRPTTAWDKKKIEAWIDVEDFQGSGKVTSVGAGSTGSIFTFNGPMERGKTKKPVSITFEGWDLVLGGEADIKGHWHRR
jgi:hypothetical protein